jgi:hypothetical protein
MRARLSLIVAVLALVANPGSAAAADPALPGYGGPLTGAQEAPVPVVTAATGEGTAVVSADGSTITYIVTYTGLSGPVTAAHIHLGAVGVSGGVILPLTAGPSPMVGTLTATNLNPSAGITFADAVAALRAGNTYFNLHTAANAAGEIRGQIVAKGDAYLASLAGFQEVGPVATSGTGSGLVVISTDASTITYLVTYSGLSGALTAAHIHTGAVGVNGGVILPLTAGPSPMTGTLTSANFTPSGAVTDFAGAVAAIRAGTTYINLHTAANPGGEIRGQIAVTVAAPAPSPTATASVAAPIATPVVTAPPTSTGDAVPPAAGGSGLVLVLAVLAAITVLAHPRLREVLVRR